MLLWLQACKAKCALHAVSSQLANEVLDYQRYALLEVTDHPRDTSATSAVPGSPLYELIM